MKNDLKNTQRPVNMASSPQAVAQSIRYHYHKQLCNRQLSKFSAL
jgi:hypothetical protein